MASDLGRSIAPLAPKRPSDGQDSDTEEASGAKGGPQGKGSKGGGGGGGGGGGATSVQDEWEWVKEYSPDYIYGQLMFWYKQTLAEPGRVAAPLRRGCLQLPDPTSCYSRSPLQAVHRGYGPTQRKEMLERLVSEKLSLPLVMSLSRPLCVTLSTLHVLVCPGQLAYEGGA